MFFLFLNKQTSVCILKRLEYSKQHLSLHSIQFLVVKQLIVTAFSGNQNTDVKRGCGPTHTESQ